MGDHRGAVRCPLTRDSFHGSGVGRHLLRGDANSCAAQQDLSVFTLFGQDDRDDIT
jgi:hypothetical protein